MKIMVVEDNVADADLLLDQQWTMVPRPQFDVVDHLSTALCKLQANEYDVILLDLNLPDSRGSATYEKVIQAAPRTAVVVLTGIADSEAGLRAMQCGAQDFLVKGATPPEVLERAIRYAMERKHSELLLQQARQMETIGQLAGGVAHDFNNLMMVISTYAEMAMQDVEPGHKAHLKLDKLQAAVGRAAELTKQLLALSRRHVIRPETFRVADALASMESMLHTAIGERITLVVDNRCRGSIRTDRAQFEQAMLNLAVNARDAMPGGGILTISSLDVVQGGREVVQLSVRDTGPGIDEATRQRMFDPFFTTKPEGKGTGLGLALVQTFVVRCGGTICVHSEVGRGAEFEMSFPSVPTQAPAASCTGDACRIDLHAAILLVEDEAAARDAISEFLSTHGFLVRAAGNLAEARTLAAAQQFDLLLTDVILPDGSGRELADEANERGQTVILMSGYTDRALPDHSPYKYLQKPFRLRELLGAIRECLSGEQTVSPDAEFQHVAAHD